MPSQSSSSKQDNQESTPSSQIAPGDPSWGVDYHVSKSYGQGYDGHDPVSLLKGDYTKGLSLIRFGKFSFKDNMSIMSVAHGDIFKVPIIRTEGNKGTWTVVVGTSPSKNTGFVGEYNTTIEHGYHACKVDIDIISRNRHFSWASYSNATNQLSVTFPPGITEREIEVIVPYRTRVDTLLPDVLERAFTYWVQEYNPVRGNNYNGTVYTEQDYCSRLASQRAHFSPDSPGDHASAVTNHNTKYKVYTLPMPRSWIENLIGNDRYIYNWDKNYDYRVVNNTERPKFMPNRADDETLPDEETDGYISRYDHTDKIEVVTGKSRFTKFCMRRQSATNSGAGCSCYFASYKTQASNLVSNNYQHFNHGPNGPATFGWLNKAFSIYNSSVLINNNNWMAYPNEMYKNAMLHRTSSGGIPGPWPSLTNRSVGNPSASRPWYIPGVQFVYNWWWKRGGASWMMNTASQHSPGDYYMETFARPWISNDTRITHRLFPAYPKASVTGNLVLKNSVMEERVDGTYHSPHEGPGNKMWGPVPSTTGGLELSLNRFFPQPGGEDPTKWEHGQRPLPNSGWTRADSPECPTLKYIANNRPDADKMHDDPAIHPEVSAGAMVGTENYQWGPIPYGDQSWYESRRYGLDDTTDKVHELYDLEPRFDLTRPGTTSIGGLAGNAGLFLRLDTYPTDVVLPYGNPTTGIGDLAQVMFNHPGTVETNYINGPVHVMKYEDPSHLKIDYDFPGPDISEPRLGGGYGINTSCGCCCYQCCSRYGSYNVFTPEIWPNFGGYTTPDVAGANGVAQDYSWDDGDWTDQWINAATNSPLSAGKLDSLDVAGANYPAGYRWDGAQVDTSQGTGVNAQVGLNGSPGHGENGTSRFLHDWSAAVHPLSSYEKNTANLQGYYKTCIDHLDRQVFLTLGKNQPDDPYDLGSTLEITVNITKTMDIDINKWAKYDSTVQPDHAMSMGVTYRTGDDWNSPPTGQTLVQRMFDTGPVGVNKANATNSVLFMGVSAGNYPGGTMTSSLPIPPLRAAKLRVVGPINAIAYNALELHDSVVSDNYLKWSDAPNQCTTRPGSQPCSIQASNHAMNPLVPETKNYDFTFKNAGEMDMVLRFPALMTAETQWELLDANLPSSDVNGWDMSEVGDRVQDWTWGITSPFRVGPSSSSNTVSLSANEEIIVQYTVTAHTGNSAGYHVYHDITVDKLTAGVSVNRLEFNVGVT